MAYYWVVFHGRGDGCVEASNEEEALRLGTELTGYDTAQAAQLRYPANPRLNPNPSDPYYCPSLCYRPVECSRVGGCTAPRPCND